MKPLAPVAVFAFKRLDLLRQTLASLERCKEFRESPVCVFSDGARLNQPGEGDAVARLRQWLRPWCAKHGAALHEADSNKGLRPSITSGVTALAAQHERVIVLEDDIVVSPAFLTFMNEALDACRNRKDIYQVSGYNVPHRRQLPDAGLLRVPACWGWATWNRAWASYSDDATVLLNQIRKRDTHAFNINGSYDYLESLERNATGTQNTWMVRWYASVFLRNGLTVYPGGSLTRNIGFGEDGTNCGPGSMTRTFTRQPIARKLPHINWQEIGAVETPSYAAALEEFYHWQLRQWTKPTVQQRITARWRRLVRGGSRG